VSNRFEAPTLRGTVTIDFGVNRWVLVSIGSDEGQSQIDTRDELAAYLRERGLSDREANEFSQEAWKQRPGSAADHVPTPGEGFVAATGLSSGTALVLVIAIVAAFVLITVYVFVLRR
jgi:preprotein translocase subunit SecF